jgi:hypothetical protein
MNLLQHIQALPLEIQCQVFAFDLTYTRLVKRDFEAVLTQLRGECETCPYGCGARCMSCESYTCNKCVSTSGPCTTCKLPRCNSCAVQCGGCNNQECTQCVFFCELCNIWFCQRECSVSCSFCDDDYCCVECTLTCEMCQNVVCCEHEDDMNWCDRCDIPLCQECTFNCDYLCGSTECRDYNVTCERCSWLFCNECRLHGRVTTANSRIA